MKSLAIKDIIEYIAASAIVLVFVIILIFFYGYYETEQYNLQSYEIFTQSLLVDRLNYCLYKVTGNPYYLFYAPTNSTLYKYWDQVSGCFEVYSGFFSVFNQTYNIQNNNGNSVQNEKVITYANISYTAVPYLIFYDTDNLSYSYVFFYNASFNQQQIQYAPDGSAVSLILINNYISPPTSVNIQNNQELQSLLSQYLFKETNYTSQLLANITRFNNTFQDIYSECLSNNYQQAVFIFPIISQSIFEPNYNGIPIDIGIYQFGNASISGYYNITCDYSNGQYSNCHITK